MNKSITVSLRIDMDYIMGHLRYGHYEGKITLTPEEFEILKANPQEAVETLDLRSYLNLVIDDFSVDHIGDITEVKIKEVT